MLLYNPPNPVSDFLQRFAKSPGAFTSNAARVMFFLQTNVVRSVDTLARWKGLDKKEDGRTLFHEVTWFRVFIFHVLTLYYRDLSSKIARAHPEMFWPSDWREYTLEPFRSLLERLRKKRREGEWAPGKLLRNSGLFLFLFSFFYYLLV